MFIYLDALVTVINKVAGTFPAVLNVYENIQSQWEYTQIKGKKKGCERFDVTPTNDRLRMKWLKMAS